ncbi:hypothetical protein [Petrimonas sp.]|uniref:hypothetical protein n=1 Tax=Petrimonas sp. TaxID=2023866 RepID=UPI002FC60399
MKLLIMNAISWIIENWVALSAIILFVLYFGYNKRKKASLVQRPMALSLVGKKAEQTKNTSCLIKKIN